LCRRLRFLPDSFFSAVSSCGFAQLSWFSVYASTAVSWSYFLAAIHFSPAARGLRAREHSFVRSQIFAAGLPSLLDLPAGQPVLGSFVHKS
jgi:hypothetical protein